MRKFEVVQEYLRQNQHAWLVTGIAGFIGSHLLERLLRLDQKVVGLDNFATGHRRNLDLVQADVRPDQWANFRMIEGDIRALDVCREACRNADYVLHQAALGSVPRSIADPIQTNAVNIDGFLNMLVAARDAGVKRFVYASSSSIYGDHPALPKVEDVIGRPLSPYATTKAVNELYAEVFARCYDFKSIGMRYFNIFGKRQDPQGAYAAVIPKWVASMLSGEPVYINGDGETSRDFCYVDNAVQANLLAALATGQDALNRAYNVAVNEWTTLNQLFEMIRELLARHVPSVRECRPVYRDFRPGDVRHSLADIGAAQRLLGYEPTHKIGAGLGEAMDWYVADLIGLKSGTREAQGGAGV